MARVIFLSPAHDFSGKDLREKAVGGIIGNTIMLAENLARNNHEVKVYNAIKSSSVYEGIEYTPFDSYARIDTDIAIANNSARPFRNVTARKKIVWQHNRTNWRRVWKRGELWELLRDRPNLVCLSPNAARSTSKTLPYRSKTIIQHGIEPIFLKSSPKSSAPLKPQALFASRPYRGFDWLLKTWKRHILPIVPEAILHVCTPKTSKLEAQTEWLKAHNIIHHGPLTKANVVRLMRECRVLLYPSHRDETG